MSLIKQHLHQQEEEMQAAYLIYMESQRNKAKRKRAEQSRESAQRSTKN